MPENTNRPNEFKVYISKENFLFIVIGRLLYRLHTVTICLIFLWRQVTALRFTSTERTTNVNERDTLSNRHTPTHYPMPDL